MQQLSFEVKLEEVDVFYPFHPQGRLTAGVSRDKKIRVNWRDHIEWIEGLTPDHVWQVLLNYIRYLFITISCINNIVFCLGTQILYRDLVHDITCPTFGVLAGLTKIPTSNTVHKEISGGRDG